GGHRRNGGRGGGVVVVTREDHPSGRGLQRAGDGGFQFFADPVAGVLDHDHRAVVEVTDALGGAFAVLDDADAHRLAGQHNRAQGAGQVVEVHHVNPAQRGDLVEVVIVGHQPALAQLAERDQLLVDVVAVHLGVI